jgi:hypothetical protein
MLIEPLFSCSAIATQAEMNRAILFKSITVANIFVRGWHAVFSSMISYFSSHGLCATYGHSS